MRVGRLRSFVPLVLFLPDEPISPSSSNSLLLHRHRLQCQFLLFVFIALLISPKATSPPHPLHGHFPQPCIVSNLTIVVSQPQHDPFCACAIGTICLDRVYEGIRRRGWFRGSTFEFRNLRIGGVVGGAGNGSRREQMV
jgi:hypothetical protein